ncbi:MAG TPA: hypothetical protein G4O06_02195 [Dehalococcoidia bacterium]|jgi:hypothetical protein|nr:hypothetical protein [Dehalococcoidia bacterium]
MKRDNEFNNILDECLERLLAKGETIEQCLQSYPEYTAELEPLLHTVVATKEALAIQPRPEFKSEARHQFRLALQKVEPKRRLSFLGWQPRWAIAMVALLVLLLAGGGTVAAAGNSMPDSLLHPVKLATEQVRLRLTPSDIGKAELYAKLADRRVAEIVYMVNKGKPEYLWPTAERLNKHLALIADLSLAESVEAESVELAEDEGGRVMLAPAPAAEESGKEEDGQKDVQAKANERTKLRTLLGRNSVNHLAELRAVLETAPESAKPALRQVINELAAGYEKALQALD